MMQVIRILGVVLGVGLLLSACTTAGKPPPVAVTEQSSGQTFALARNQQFIVRLASNPTTGYSWGVAPMTTGTLKAEGPSTYQQEPAGANVMGAGGTETWRFTAAANGQEQLRFDYRRPWEKDVAPERVVVYTVSVK